MPIKNLTAEHSLASLHEGCAWPSELVGRASGRTLERCPTAAIALAVALMLASSCGGPEPSRSAPPEQKQGTSQADREGKPGPAGAAKSATATGPGAVSAAELRFRVYPWLVRSDGTDNGGTRSPKLDESVALLALDADCGIAIVPRVRDGNVYREATSAEAALIDGFGPKLATIYRENLARLFTEAGPLTVVGDPSGPGMRFLDFDTDIAGTEALILLPETWDKVEATLGRAALLALPDRKLCRFLSAGPWLVNVEMAKDFAVRHREGSMPLAAGFLWRDRKQLRVGPSFDDLVPN